MKISWIQLHLESAPWRRLFTLATLQVRRSMGTSVNTTPRHKLNRTPAKPKICQNKAGPDEGCPVCREGLQYFGYRDVLLLRQFLSPEGYIIGRRYTKICPKLQRRVAKSIRRSRKMGLLPNFQAESAKVSIPPSKPS